MVRRKEMTVFDKSPPRWRLLAGALTVAACLALVASSASAVTTTYLLEDRNSELKVDISDDFPTSDGLFQWKMNGVLHMWKQWFWYRIGDTGPEEEIDTIGYVSANVEDDDADPGNEKLELVLEDDTLRVSLFFRLVGGTVPSGTADLVEQIEIENKTGDYLDFNFFQYVDFDLNDQPMDDVVTVTNGNTMSQVDEQPGMIAETVVTPRPARWEIDQTYQTAVGDTTILGKLSDGDADDLASSGLEGQLGPDDVAWGFQWKKSITPYGVLIISKDKHLAVPEPVTMLGVMLGVGGLFGYIRKRR
jgi:hypothetical protein